ncbi:hypothetical protein BX616_005426 [Lobosporangium transversale]|uniref:Beta/gamma crystallin 'Greek key' domain-containing protein n=1 Tax=Lobosporangium transversale TaxID=64571 RepID=A0A1Y2GMA3_9FUNG|nr:hypothetical protein BCR41DRAFT_356676 [Lobosporangium transversale]KAF9918812.1 hypothetical protein BX616_005426 [Lobosporangium transversale]ORZ11636.1 hypothetical protein BCR41DRAFT_356676 [Lobosporangium transversale]|eukprot:XP_021879733.1 hypothetical protein BCR41DRAFT_356676 [Lobosporangium transversale]
MPSLLRTIVAAFVVLIFVLEDQHNQVSAQKLNKTISSGHNLNLPKVQLSAQDQVQVQPYSEKLKLPKLRFYEHANYEGRCVRCVTIGYNDCYTLDPKRFEGTNWVSSISMIQEDPRDGPTTATFYTSPACGGEWFRYSENLKGLTTSWGSLGSYNDQIRSFKIANFYVEPGTGSNQPDDRRTFGEYSCHWGKSNECQKP